MISASVRAYRRTSRFTRSSTNIVSTWPISVAWSSAYQINLATFHHDFWAAALCMAQYRRQLANRQMDHFIIIAMQMILFSIIEPRILEHFSVRLHKERARSDTVQAAEKCSSDK